MPSIPGREVLEHWLLDRGIGLDPSQWSQLENYLQEVSSHNEKVNLTADSGEILFLRHAADALAALAPLKRRLDPITQKPRILDLGAGAGFIGITLKIAWPDAEITLLESSRRKFEFLNWICAKMKSPGLRVVLGRAPHALGGSKFDGVIVRAVAPLEDSARLGLSVARENGGLCLCFQTHAPEVDDHRFLEALRGVGARLAEIVPYRLPVENSDRNLVFLERGGFKFSNS